MKLKVGDKVTLRKGLKKGNQYAEYMLYDSMYFDGEKEIIGMNLSGFEIQTAKYSYWYPRYMLKKIMSKNSIQS